MKEGVVSWLNYEIADQLTQNNVDFADEVASYTDLSRVMRSEYEYKSLQRPLLSPVLADDRV